MCVYMYISVYVYVYVYISIYNPSIFYISFTFIVRLHSVILRDDDDDDLTGKHSPNVLPWENEQQCALFELLRGKMCCAHVLRIPQLGRPYTLHTDASGSAVGATLRQLDEAG